MNENIKGPGQISSQTPEKWPGNMSAPPIGTDRPIDDVVSTNNKILFWASFLTLIAAGMGFSIRGDILSDWGKDFGFTQTDLGEITGMGLARVRVHHHLLQFLRRPASATAS